MEENTPGALNNISGDEFDSFNISTNTSDGYIPYVFRMETYVVPTVFSIIFLLGFLGNGGVIVIFIGNKSMRSTPNILILSLAVGDFLVTVGTVPFISTIYTFDSWPYGVFTCKLSEFLKDLSSGVTALTLTLLSIDRYVAIVKPFRKINSNRDRKLTIFLAALVWVIAIIIATPGAYFSFLWEIYIDADRVIQVCYPFPLEMNPWYPHLMILIKFIFLYSLPLLLISVFYALMARNLFFMPQEDTDSNATQIRKRRVRIKVAKIVLVFTGLFAVCLFPIHVFMFWFYFNTNAIESYNGFWHNWKILAYVLLFSNSCVNPVALYFISSAYRREYKKYLFCCRKNVPDARRRRIEMANTRV